MHHCLTHHVSCALAHQLIVMRHNLTGGECEGAKKIEFADDPEYLAVFHHQKRIEIVLLE
jgi:hypothetical protein